MADLHRAVGCHYRHLAQFEKGKRYISTELAYRLARALTDLSGTTVTIDDFTDTARDAA